uniref:FERM, ARHGEF and pleckstrin domain-containing protein 1 n=1 Tax=Branchiostoma floridae TaxID=7739 RepID=C3ZF05_BRAFL|eukprot:XP_002593300.1 hypothetical protein BRAFLDRAFT_123643 [Branchiostoma floridae]
MSGIEVADNRTEGVELRDVQPRRRPEVGNGGDPPTQQPNNNVPARNGPTNNNRTARKGKCIPVKVLLLDDTLSTFEIQTKACGQELFNAVKDHLQLGESDYFGLEYNDPAGNTTWLDPMKMILKQVKDPKKVMFRFCVKFFSPDPGQLHDEFTRYLFAMQVRRDLATGRLPSSDNTAALMASYIVQAEVGDFTAEEHPESSYITEFKFVPNQTPQMENKIMEFHQKLAGQTPADADRNFLDIARRLEMYGIRLHPAHDHDGVKINLAVANMGVLIFQGHTKINTFSWAKIRKLSFKRKRFLIKLHPEAYGLYNATVEFVMSSRDACKSFWKLCIEYHAFFRLEVRPKPVPKSILFSRGSSFRFSGRTQKQLIEDMREGGSPSKNPKFQRSHKLRASTQSLQIMPTHEVTRLDTNNMRANSFSHYETQDPRFSPYIKPPSDQTVVPATQLDKSGDRDEHAAMHDLVGEMTSEHDAMQGLVRQMSSEHDQMQHLVKKITALHADSDEVIDQPDGEKEEAGTPGSEGNDAVPSASSDTGIGNDSPSSAGAISTDEPVDLPTNVLLQELKQADTADTNDNCVQECQGKSPTLKENPSNLQNLSEASSKMLDNDYQKSAGNASSNSPLTSNNNPVVVNGTNAEILGFANAHASFGSGLVHDGSDCHIPYQSPCELHITEDEIRPYSSPHNIPLHITEDSSSSSDSCSEPPSAPNSPALHIQKAQNLPCRNDRIPETPTKVRKIDPSSIGDIPGNVSAEKSPMLSPLSSVSTSPQPSVISQDRSPLVTAPSQEEDETRKKVLKNTKRYPADKAYYIAKELLSTERTYLKDLEVIVVWFRNAVIQDMSITESLAHLLFDNFDPLYEFHRGFLKEIEQRMALWEGRSNAHLKGDYQRIGDILLKNMKSLKLYMQHIEKHEEILLEMEKATRRNQKLENVYKEFEMQKVCYLPLNTFLLKPAQRLLHYRLILERLVKHYPVDHRDYKDCRAALAEIMEATSNVQDSMNRLFSDMILYTSKGVTATNQFKVHGQLPVRGMVVEESEMERAVANCFTVYSTNKSVVVAASTTEEKDKWMEDINDVIVNAAERGLGSQDSSFSRSSDEMGTDREDGQDESEDDIHSPRGSLDRTHTHHRANTTMHVCWHRNTSVSMADHTKSVENQLSGYLLRKFKNSNGWQKLWVVFTNFCLFFYKTHQDDYPLASLPLLGYQVSTPAETDNIHKDYVFKLQFKTHVYFFRAESEYTFGRWMEVISSATFSASRTRIFSRKES